MKMRKIVVLLLSAILAGCRFNSSIDEIVEGDNAIIEISIKDSAVKSARSAIPVIDSGETITYSIVATNGSETVGPVTQKASGTDVYQLAVTPGEWVVNATGTSDSTGKDILFGSRTVMVSESGKYGTTITMQYIMGEGIDGSVDLSVRLGSLTRYPIAKMTISGTGTLLDSTYLPTSSKMQIISNVPTGNYNPILKFYDSSNNLLCVVTERISVRKNRTTKTWIKNGTETWLKDSGSGVVFELSDEIIDSIVNKTFFVKGTGGTLTATASDANSGTWAAPFKTVQKAIDKVMAINDKHSPYTIYVDGEVKDEVLDNTKDFISVIGTDYINLKIQGFNGNNEVDIINANRVSSLPTTTTPIVENPSNRPFIEVSNNNSSSVFALTHLTLKGGSRQNGNIIMDFSPSTEIENCVICENSIKKPSNGSPIRIINSSNYKLLILKDTIIKNNYIGANSSSNEKGAVYADQLFIGGKCYIYDNYGRLYDNNIEQDTITTTQFNVYTEPSGTYSFINIMGDITGSKIGVVRALNISVGRNDYFTFTKDFSTNCPATTKPSQIFISDQGYTIGWNSDASEAAMTISSYTPTIQMYEDLEIRCLKSRIINPTGCGDSGRTVEFRLYSKTTGEDLTDTASWSIKPKYIGSVLQNAYCSVSSNKCTFAENIPYEIFNITAIATAHGTTVSTAHNVQVVELSRASTLGATIPANNSVIALADINDLNQIKEWMEDGASAQSYELILQNDFTIQDFETIDVGAANAYSGTLDGNGHSITMNTTDGNDSYGGIFGCIGAATVKNLTLKGSLTKNGGVGAVGALADTTGSNAVTIQYCENHVNITNNSTGTNSYTGGFIGSGTANITHCKNHGNITGNYLAGGFIGNGKNVGMISNCVNEGEIHASTTNPDAVAGSIIANISMSTTYSIYNCVNKGTVEAYSAGGIAYDASKVINCSNYGPVIGINNVSGILGYSINPTVKNCLNAGEISTANKRGAILANWGGNSTIVNNFYLKNADSLTGIGNGSNDISRTCAFTSNGSTSSTVEPITVSSTKYTDVVYLLNNWVNTNTPPAGAPAYSKWTYDSNGLPKLMCEE